VTKAVLDDLIATLERFAADLSSLAELDDETRRRLVNAAGAVSRPDRYTRKALSKALVRNRKKATRAADDAVLDGTGIRTLRKKPMVLLPPREAVRTPALPMEALLEEAPEEAADWDAAEAERGPGRVRQAQTCYVCKADFHELHHFYDQMCAACAELNWRKRNQSADLRGRVALVTGGRVKIGFQAALKLLRAGAEVVVVTRFPRDGARRFASEADASEWSGRLHVYGVDLRHTPSVVALCAHLLETLPRLDILLSTACQTVRRPSGFYDHLMSAELAPAAEEPALERWESLRHDRALPEVSGGSALFRSAVLTQIPLLADDLERGGHLYPAGRFDADLQQVDLRSFNSLRMTLTDVPTAELLEVQLVNAIAPFVLNARLKPLMARVSTRDTHIINVSAMEGQFYRRFKTDKHPHTNMAKAALNMLTRTSAIDYIRDGIHMNSVDTGWVTDEDPVEIAARKVAEHRFHTPLDIIDGADRIVDPPFSGLLSGTHRWGLFFKDYAPTTW
jgi:NAD(P)-dependent dehydrogenase (short-subunit alcohol dehydrogenase family)